MPLSTLRAPDDRTAAAEAARLILDARLAATDRRFALALSGGRIAPLLFAELVAQSKASHAGIADADFFWADERCVGPEHADSNFCVAKSALLDPLGVPADPDRGRVHRLHGELDPAAGAARANADWERFLGDRADTAHALDVVVLGVGEDGHVASLFPENLTVDLAAETPFRAVTGSKPPPWRLTMGYPLLWQAGLVVVLATGSGKEAAVRGSLAGDPSLPLARVFAGRAAQPTVLVTNVH